MPITSRGPGSRAGYNQLPSYADPSSDSNAMRLMYRARSRMFRWSWHPPSLPGTGRVPLSKRLLRWAIVAGAATILLVLVALMTWEPHLELAFYRRAWVRAELGAARTLSGCFNPDRISPSYNVTERMYGPRTAEVQAGMALKTGRDCYDFAGIVPSAPLQRPSEATIFHSYWRDDLAKFEERQEWFLRSLFATQASGSKVILWSNGDLSTSPTIASWLKKRPDTFETRKVDFDQLAKGTALEGSSLLTVKDKLAWIDGDLVRLLVLWAYGGVWVDMDSLLTRDLSPLLEHEFVTQWDCYDKPYNPFNGALLRFHKHSPYLCEAFHLMTSQHAPRPGSTDWGALLYLQLWRALVAGGIPPFRVLPWCFADARSCRLDNRLPDPFAPDETHGWWGDGAVGGVLDKSLKSIWVIHLHNQWEKAYPHGGWVERLLLNRYKTAENGQKSDL